MKQFMLAVRKKCVVYFLIIITLTLILSSTAISAAESISPLVISETDGPIEGDGFGDNTEPDGDNTEPDVDDTRPDGDNTEPDGDNTEPDGDSTESNVESTIEDDIDELDTGSEYNDTAEPEVSADIGLPENGESPESLKAVFAQDDSYVARRNDEFYTDADGGLAQALADAEAGDIVVMLEDQTLTADTAIPARVKLYIPYCEDFDADGSADGVTTSGSIYQASPRIATSDKTYRTLAIDSGVTLTVDGTLNIGGVIGHPSQNYQGHTSGWHGKIENNGAIVIGNGGILDCWGFITGSGTVTGQYGAKVYEPFIVYDFVGGWNTVDLYFAGQSPFKQYAMQNIRTQLVICSGAKLYAHCKLWAGSQYNKTDVVFVGEGGLYQPASGATFIRTYDEAMHISTNTDIGKTTYVFNGGMTVSYMLLIVEGVSVSTENVDFPIPYNTDIVLINGNYFPGKLKIMPGATLRVESNANLIVEDTLYVLDGLIQSDMSGKYYPSAETLQNAGFSASGQLFVNGTMTVKQGAVFGGIVQTSAEDGNAAVTIEKGAIVNKTGVKDGAKGAYDVNTSVFDLPARAYIYNTEEQEYTLMGLAAERTYTSYDDTLWTIDSYTMTYAEDCSQEERSDDIPYVSDGYHKWTTATVPLNEGRIGCWVSSDPYYTVKVVSSTVYDSTDTSRVTVASGQLNGDRAQIGAGGEFVFSVTATEAGSGYVYLVTCTSGSGEPVVLTPDGEGNYSISDVKENATVTVTACILGDPSFDGRINASDLLVMRRIIVGQISPSPLQSLAANTNRDSQVRINASDLLQLRRYIVGNIDAF